MDNEKEKKLRKLAKEMLEHYIDLQYYSNEVKEQLANILEEYEEELYGLIDTYDYYNTKAQYNEVASQIKESTKDIALTFSEKFKEIAAGIIGIESAFLFNQYGFEAPKSLTVSRVTFPTFNQKETLNTFVENLQTKVTNTFTNGLKNGFTFGQSKEQIRETIENNMKSVEKGFAADTETIPNSIARIADKTIYEANSKNISGYVWVTALDNRACLVCCDYSGKRFTSDAVFPLPPLHDRCRCYIQPIINNEVPDVMTYEEYLGSISEDEKLQQMGKGRYEIYKQYPDVIKEFVNSGQKVSLEVLKEKVENRYFERQMANGQRHSIFVDFTDEMKEEIFKEADSIGIPREKLMFSSGKGTHFDDELGKVYVEGDIYPSDDGSTYTRDRLNIRSVLAHEYYGHGQFRWTELPIGDWRDEFRASYRAALDTPALTVEERAFLMRDALDRANEAGISLTYTDIIRSVLNGTYRKN